MSVQVSGQAGALAKGDDLHRNEKIRSNVSGIGAFVFIDGTKLAVGPNSSVVIDEYIYRGGGKVGKAGARRRPRARCGGSAASPITRLTGCRRHRERSACAARPSISMSDPDGVTAVTLAQRRCGVLQRAGCKRLSRRCDFLIARPNGTITAVVSNMGLGKAGRQTSSISCGKNRAATQLQIQIELCWLKPPPGRIRRGQRTH